MSSGSNPTRRRVLQALSAAGLLAQGSPLGLLAACKDKADDTGVDDELLTFAVITDAHIQADPEHPNNQVLAQTIAILNDFEPALAFVLFTGDLVDGLPSDEADWYDTHDDTALHRLAEQLATLQLPVHLVMGNHDYYLDDYAITDDCAAREALFMDHLDMPGAWHRFDWQGVAFYGLSTMQQDSRVDWAPNECGSFGEEQLAWLEDQLGDGVPAVLYFHHPLALDNSVSSGLMAYRPFEVPRADAGYSKYDDTVYAGWSDPIYALLEAHGDQIQAIFVGHGHWFVHDEYQGFPVMMGDSIGNSVQDTDHDEQPMRYHIAQINLTRGTLSIWNADWFEYNL